MKPQRTTLVKCSPRPLENNKVLVVFLCAYGEVGSTFGVFTFDGHGKSPTGHRLRAPCRHGNGSSNALEPLAWPWKAYNTHTHARTRRFLDLSRGGLLEVWQHAHQGVVNVETKRDDPPTLIGPDFVLSSRHGDG